MTFYYSMKQMFRSPLKSFFFFLLVGISAFLLAIGGNLWNMSRKSSQEFEKIFTTIGTVEQTGEDAGVYKRWDAFTKSYYYIPKTSYGDRIDEKVLDFEGADYILKPRQRPFFGAYIKELSANSGLGISQMITTEVVPLETGAADHPIKMKIVRVLEGNLKEGDTIGVFDISSPEPDIFEEGKHYIMKLGLYDMPDISEVYESSKKSADERPMMGEYYISYGMASSQYTIDGKKVYDPVNEEKSYDEVTDGFYETARGKRWIESADKNEKSFRTVPVQPTDGTKLLMPFYRNEAVISEGRDITKKEYEKGEKVCLVPDTMAILLGKSLGDSLKLPLYYANYASTPSEAFGMNGGSGIGIILNAKGEKYQVFNEQEYKIVGIYTVKDSGASPYGIGRNEVVIPWKAVPENCWKDNIQAYSRMNGANTSFQIPNGTIERYQELWNQQGIEDLKITFYDNGYTQLKDGIENRKMMSWIFLIGGCVMAVMILLFFSNLFITGQQERIAVERLLGRTKKSCAVSILSGLLLLAAAGCILGSAAGWKASGKAAQKADEKIEFDTSFSDLTVENSEQIKVKWTQPSLAMAMGMGGGMFLLAIVISSGYMAGTLKKEPLQILGKIEET